MPRHIVSAYVRVCRVCGADYAGRRVRLARPPVMDARLPRAPLRRVRRVRLRATARRRDHVRHGTRCGGVRVMSGTMTAREIIAAVHAADGWRCYVEMTGGGVATMYVGAPDADGRYLALIGPGTYRADDPTLSTFPRGDTVIGPDDDGQSVPAIVRAPADVTRYLKGIAR